MWCVTHQPFHAWQQPVPSRLTTTPAGTTPPSGTHGASHPQVLGPRLWWRALCQGLAMCCTSGPVISSEFTPLYDQLAHTTLRPASSYHSTTSELIPLYNERAHTTLRPVSSHHSTNSELTRLYDQRAHTTLRPEFTLLYDQNSHCSMTSELTPLYDQRTHTTL